MLDRSIGLAGISLALLFGVVQYYLPQVPSWASYLLLAAGLFLLGMSAALLLVHRASPPTATPEAIEQQAASQSSEPEPPLPQPSQPAIKESKHISIYKYEANLDPELTPSELSLLKRLAALPRVHWYGGFRHDYLYDQLLSDIPRATLILLLQSLFFKGYIAVCTTDDNYTKYYRLSDNGVLFVVNNGLAQLGDA